MKKATAALAMMFILAACGGGTDETGSSDPPNTATGDDRTDVVSGTQPLSHYKDQASYDWRKRLLDTNEELVAAMQGVAPHLDEGDLGDVISTCDAIERGATGGQLVEQSIVRFSGGPDDQVDAGQARALIDLSREHACPEV